jgi:ABC-type branched-subunit amino acid transport system substrate-binding protein
MKAYFAYVNANGGVNGRKINLIIKDDKYIPQEAINMTNELILKDKVMAIVGALGTANNLAVASKVQIASRGVPSLFVNTGFSGFADKKKFPTTFALFPSYAMEAKAIATYLKENLPTAKTCVLLQNDDFGADAAAGFKTGGVTFTETVKYVSGTQSSATGQTWVGKFAAAKCEVVVLFGVGTANAIALGVAAAGGYKPQWILGSVGSDVTTIKATLNNPQATALMNGAIGASWAPDSADLTDEYVKQFREINTTYNAGAVFDGNVMVGMNEGLLIVQALRAAGSNPTRKSLIAAIEKKGSTFATAGYSTLAYSATSHVGQTGFWFGKYNLAGELKSVDGKYTMYTTDSAAGPVVKTEQKRLPMPAKGLPSNS